MFNTVCTVHPQAFQQAARSTPSIMAIFGIDSWCSDQADIALQTTTIDCIQTITGNILVLATSEKPFAQLVPSVS